MGVVATEQAGGYNDPRRHTREHRFELGNEAVTDPVAPDPEVLVARILGERELQLCNGLTNRRSRHGQQRLAPAFRLHSHPSEPGCAGATHQVAEHRFDLIIGVVPCRDRCAPRLGTQRGSAHETSLTLPRSALRHGDLHDDQITVEVPRQSLRGLPKHGSGWGSVIHVNQTRVGGAGHRPGEERRIRPTRDRDDEFTLRWRQHRFQPDIPLGAHPTRSSHERASAISSSVGSRSGDSHARSSAEKPA